MASRQTRLDPEAPDFAVNGIRKAPLCDTPPHAPPEESIRDVEDVTTSKVFDEPELPSWMLVDENERLRVAALTLDRMFTRDACIARLQQFADMISPGFNIASTHQSGTNTVWKPFAVHRMPPSPHVNPTVRDATFSRGFIENELRGTEWSPGFYFIHPQNRRHDIKVTAYWILDSDIDPFLPVVPGEYGAKLTPFFNYTLSQAGAAPAEEDYMNVPVFIGRNHTCAYRYFGHYSQTRYSDKLDYERMVDGTVPPFVLDVWAKNLTSDTLAPWVKDALREHLWPRPTYSGPMPLDLRDASTSEEEWGTASANVHQKDGSNVKRAIREYTEELRQWQVDSKLKVSMLTEHDIRKSFKAADADEQPGLRLWLEYLECMGYDKGFYESLAAINSEETQGWRWRYVERIADSDHALIARELCPPPMPRPRMDSLTGYQHGSTGRNGVEDQKNAAPGSLAPMAPPLQSSTTATQSNAATTLRQKGIPPHLRGKANKTANDATAIALPGTSSSKEQAETAKALCTGDPDAAQQLASGFTKTKPERGSSDSTIENSPLDKNSSHNFGWTAAAKEFQKKVALSGPPNVMW